jgi:hypothetical protein
VLGAATNPTPAAGDSDGLVESALARDRRVSHVLEFKQCTVVLSRIGSTELRNFLKDLVAIQIRRACDDCVIAGDVEIRHHDVLVGRTADGRYLPFERDSVLSF